MKVSGGMLRSGARTQLCCRVSLLVGGCCEHGGARQYGCVKVPCRVDTARNELEGQLVRASRSSPSREFLGPLLSYPSSHSSPLQPRALGNLYLLSPSTLSPDTQCVFKATSASV